MPDNLIRRYHGKTDVFGDRGTAVGLQCGRAKCHRDVCLWNTRMRRSFVGRIGRCGNLESLLLSDLDGCLDRWPVWCLAATYQVASKDTSRNLGCRICASIKRLSPTMRHKGSNAVRVPLSAIAPIHPRPCAPGGTGRVARAVGMRVTAFPRTARTDPGGRNSRTGLFPNS